MRPFPQRALADRVDVRVGGLAVRVDADAAALADREAGGARQLVARADAGGEHDDVGLQRGAVGEHQAVARGLRRRRFPSCSSQVCTLTPSASIFLRSSRPAGVVELHRHQARRELDHVRLAGRGPSAPWPPPGRAGRRRSPCRPCERAARRADHLEVLDGAVDEAVAPVAPGHRRHEGSRSRWRAPACRRARPGSAPSARSSSTGSIDSTRVVQPQRDAVLLEEASRAPRFRSAADLAGEEARELHAVVGRARLLAEHGDLAARRRAATSCSRKRWPTMPLPMTTTRSCGLRLAVRHRRVCAKRTTSPTTMIAGPAKPDAPTAAPSVADALPLRCAGCRSR